MDASTALLDIDAGAFRESFDRRPFTIGHRLAGHPLFALPRLLELARALPRDHVEYNAGLIPVDMRDASPANGLSAEETIRRIAECRSWMALKWVEHDPQYRRLLEDCLAEIRVHAEPLRPGMQLAQGFIFLSSPGSVTPYHMDPEHNFLLQIRGSKHITLFDRAVALPEEIEGLHEGRPRNMALREEYRARSSRHELTPGIGLHFPSAAPHYVQNGPEVSISFSVTFRTPDQDGPACTHLFNAWMRRRGLAPAPLGCHPVRDRVKSLAWRVAARARRLAGR